MTAVAEGPAATTSAVTPEMALERATKWANDYAAHLTERAEQRLAVLAGHANGNGMRPRIGEPTTGDPTTGFYVGFDVVATSPIQFGGPPPYQPSKVIAAGEQAFIIAFIFVNPTVNIPLGWAVPATVQLGGRTWRMTLDQGNLPPAACCRSRSRPPPSPARHRRSPRWSSRWPLPTLAPTRL